MGGALELYQAHGERACESHLDGPDYILGACAVECENSGASRGGPPVSARTNHDLPEHPGCQQMHGNAGEMIQPVMIYADKIEQESIQEHETRYPMHFIVRLKPTA